MGLIQSDFVGVPDPVQAFHAGTLPLIVDALDEGRLLSGERGFEGFLETTGELILRDRSVTDRPKLILFGRHESADLAMLGFEVSGSGITTCPMEVGFFEENAAWDLIDAYARSSAKPDAAYLRHPEPVDDLIRAYFSAIESALGLDHGRLWANERGRAFAGYAPVLAALGSLLAELDNFSVVANKLRSGGSREAWGVIETVLKEILDREQRKLTDKLALHIQTPVPNEAYDAQEQPRFLTRFAHLQKPADSGRVPLPGSDKAKYFNMVEQYLPEHPFIRQGEFGNAVLGSLVLAHAVAHDLLKDTDLRLLESFSRQPFVWRSLRRQLAGPDMLIDGRYLGCVLNSFWSDPITQDHRVIVRSGGDDGSVGVWVPGDIEGELLFEITLPVILYGQIRDSDVDVRDTVTLKGHARRDSDSAFYIYGNTTIICDQMDIAADSLTLDGRVWLEAGQVTAPPRLSLHPRHGSEIGWAGQFAEQYPWNQFSTTLKPPYTEPIMDPLTELIDECRARLPGRGGVLTLNTDFSVPDDDRRMRWVLRRFPDAFPRLIRLMVDHELASTETMEASGSRPKTRVRFSVTWEDLRSTVRETTTDPRLRALIVEAQRAIRG